MLHKYITLILLAVLCFSCSKMEDIPPVPDPNGNVKIKLKFDAAQSWAVSKSDSETRASGITTTQENTIYDVWIFQFNGTSSGSVLFAPPRYVSSADFSNPVFFADGGSTLQRFVFIANMSNSGYEWNMTVGASTLANLTSKIQAISDESELYASNRLLMTGYVDSYTSASNMAVSLRHNVARIELTLSCTAPNIVIDQIQLCDVPANIDVLAGSTVAPTPLYARAATYPALGSSLHFNYPAQTTNMPASAGVSKTYFWYMPSNLRGTVSNDQVKLKNVYAPRLASYIKVTARDTGTTPNTPVIYTFYPGGNMTNDFDIKPNGNYKMNVTIVGKNDAQVDSRIEDRAVVSFAGTPANCYILNPPLNAATTAFRIYPTNVDRFWGFHYENVPANVLGDNSPWTVDVLWMDEASLATNTANDGNIKLTKKTGTGVNDYFEVSVPNTSKTGNMVVYIYKNSDPATILWSWHLWVTDYNPDANVAAPVTDKYVYNVPGGVVHRYSGSYWTGGTYPYFNRFMMDRDLGQMDSYPATSSASTSKGYLYYQYGRKDPFPANITLRNLAGATVTYSNTANALPGGTGSGVGLATAVKNPLKFYSTNSSQDSWMDNRPKNEGSSGDVYDYWFDKNVKGTPSDIRDDIEKTQKSLYDPCPPGWKVPGYYAYIDFTYKSTVMNADRAGTEWSLDGRAGVRYWPLVLVDGSYPVQGRIFFPAGGYRYYYNGSIAGSGSYLTRWTTIPSAWYGAYHLYGYSTGFSYASASLYTHSNGHQVRCTKE